MNATLTGQVNVKFRAFRIDLFWIKKKVNETYPINLTGNIIKFSKNNVEFALNISKVTEVTLTAKYQGIQLFSQTFKPEVNLTIPFKYSDHGIFIDLVLAVKD